MWNTYVQQRKRITEMLTAGVFGDGDTLQQRLSFRDRLELEFDTAGWSSNARNWLYSMAWANASTADPSTARHAVAEAYRALREAAEIGRREVAKE